MFGLLDWIKIGSGVIVGAALMSAPAYWYGKIEGKSAAAVAAVKAANKAYKDRNDENASVEALDSVGLCIKLGGLPDDCAAELRGMGKNHGQAGDGDLPGGE